MINEKAARRLVEAANDVTQEVVSIFRSIDEEQRELKLALASVIYRIMEEVVVPILAEFPDFKAEFEDRMNGPLSDAEG